VKIDWASLALVAVTTVVAAVSIVGIFALGVAALTHAQATVQPGGRSRVTGLARVAGYACIGVAGLIAVYGIYLIIPAFH
jgi:hypothetical protein